MKDLCYLKKKQNKIVDPRVSLKLRDPQMDSKPSEWGPTQGGTKSGLGGISDSVPKAEW